MKVTVLGGAGLMGAGIIRDLVSAQSEGVGEVIVADNNQQGIDKIKATLSDPRISYVGLDVKDSSGMKDLLSSSDVCINSVPTNAGLQMDIFHAALEAKCPYVDLGGLGDYTRMQKAEHEDWLKAGVPAVLGVGNDPGLSNVLCRAVADELDSIEKINLYWTAALLGPENPLVVPLYNIETILAEYYEPCHQFLDGELKEVPAQTGKETIELPEPFGKTEFMYSKHSEPSTVPFARGIAEKGIQEMTWKLALPEADDRVWKSLVKAGFGDFADTIQVNGVDIRPGDFLSAVINRNLERNRDKVPEQEDYQLHFAIGSGLKTASKRGQCSVSSEPNDFYQGYHDAGTSMNASFSAQLLINQDSQPGVWGPEEYFDIPAYIRELDKRHFRVRLEVTADETDPGRITYLAT